MLTLNLQKNIVVMVLILAVSCSSLLAKDRKDKGRREKQDKAKVKAPVEKKRSPAVNEAKAKKPPGAKVRRSRPKNNPVKGRDAAVAKRRAKRRGSRPLKEERSNRPKRNRKEVVGNRAGPSWPTNRKNAVKKRNRRKRARKKEIEVSTGSVSVRLNSNDNRPARKHYNKSNNVRSYRNNTVRKRIVPRKTVVKRNISIGTSRLLSSPRTYREKVRSRLGHVRNRKAVYRERSSIARRLSRYEHVYRGRRGRIQHKIIWPGYRYAVRYNYGPRVSFRYVYPYYHRKYVFVSLGGWRPVEYSYLRYYWYGSHPYRWYGYYPIGSEVRDDTHNYYTYNYYGSKAGGVQSVGSADDYGYVDHNTFADVREKLAGQDAQEPAAKTTADRYFEEAVEAFEAGDYDRAADKFEDAMNLDDEDIILPFAYIQSLFAEKKYFESVEALRAALATINLQEEGVFYPRGLYDSDETLLGQIDSLAERVQVSGYDADLQLLLGYQLLGVGELEHAEEILKEATREPKNVPAASILLDVLEKIKEAEDNSEK